jgi:hypothetical protein
VRLEAFVIDRDVSGIHNHASFTAGSGNGEDGFSALSLRLSYRKVSVITNIMFFMAQSILTPQDFSFSA